MKKFHNVLFVTRGLGDDKTALKQAISLTRNNNATLQVFIAPPEFPEQINNYREEYEGALEKKIREEIDTVAAELNATELAAKISISVESGPAAGIRVIKHAIKNSHDLVVKQAESGEAEGFKSVDMELLRKCPCAVWLCRPIEHHRQEMRVVVAIDPEVDRQPALDLSQRLLETARSLADTCNGNLHIVTCWNYEYEEYLRNSPWIKIPEDELMKNVEEAQAQHRQRLDKMVSDAKITGKIEVHHLKGEPAKLIPEFIKEQSIDVLVMGTLARTGIPGFLIGNTAENILQKVSCSLLALKPNGFVSPVTPY